MNNNCCEEIMNNNCCEEINTFSYKEYYLNLLHYTFAEWYYFEHDNTVIITKSKPLIILALNQCMYSDYIKIEFAENYEDFK